MQRAFTVGVLACAIFAFGSGGVPGPGPARADGDPASDVLLGQSVFYPYAPPVSAALQSSLNALTASAAVHGVPLHVALIDSPVDLGIIPSVFGQPQAYATFLEREISFQGPLPLLVVMPTGYGMAGVGAAVVDAARTLALPRGHTSDDLAQAALRALPTLARAAGHALPGVGTSPAAPRGDPPGSGGAARLVLVLILAGLAALAALGFGVATVRRHRATA